MARLTRPASNRPPSGSLLAVARRLRLGGPGGVSVRIGQTSGIRYVANSESMLRSPRCAALGRTRWWGFIQRQWLGRILWIAPWSIGQDPPV